MNISTYEARIAALEAQLGPGPGPVPETGLASMVVTPNILLSDGTTINEKLGELLPMISGNKNVQYETTAEQIPVTTTFNVEITPGSEWYALKGFGEQGRPIFGEKGEKNSLSFTPDSEGSRELILTITGMATATNEISDPSFQPVYIEVDISAPLL